LDLGTVLHHEETSGSGPVRGVLTLLDCGCADVCGAGAGGGSNGQAYYVNVMVPFTQSITITAQHLVQNYSAFYMVRHVLILYASLCNDCSDMIGQIVRGALNKPVDINGFILPSNAKLLLQTV
jgi:hypothetical protein